MTKRFDAILFDAGGIFLLPDPISLGAIVRAHGGDGSIERLMRAHYAGMERLDSVARASEKETIDGFSWDPYRDAYVEAAGLWGNQLKVQVSNFAKCFRHFYGAIQYLNQLQRCGECTCTDFPSESFRMPVVR